MMEKYPDNTTLVEDLNDAMNYLEDGVRRFTMINNKWLLNDEGKVDKMKLAENSHLIGGEWFEACEKVSEGFLYFTEREKALHKEFMDSIKPKGDK